MGEERVQESPLMADTREGSVWQGGQGISALTLKLIAIVAMVIDHIAWEFVPTYSVLGISMHFVGRITGPTMFYFIAEGYHYTRNKGKYILRMALFAIISYVPFIFYSTGAMPTKDTWLMLNVIYTLFLALLLLHVRHEVNNQLLRILAMGALFVLSIPGDWSYIALIYVLVFDHYRGNRKNQIFGGVAIALMYFAPSLFGGLWMLVSGGAGAMNSIKAGVMNMGMLLPMLLLCFYGGKRGAGGKWGKWLFYIVYPAHLLVIGFVKVWLGRGV